MLETLSSVDWSSIQDANGPASDLPRLFRAAASGKPGLAALREIENRIDHQGWPSEAAVPSVPFLWELALGTSGDVQPAVLVLLGNLAAGGNHENFLGTGLTPAAPAHVLPKREPGATLLREVGKRAVEALPLLSDGAPAVRAAAGFFVAIAAPGGAIEAIAAALDKEKNVPTLASLAISLGFVLAGVETKARTKHVAALRKLLTKKDVSRTGAAIGLGLAEAMNADVEKVLLAAASSEQAADVVWNEGGLAAHATEVLLSRTHGPGQVETLGRLLDAAPDAERGAVAATLLERAFAKELAERTADGVKTPIDASSLDDSQKTVLRLFQARDDLYQGSRSPVPLLERLGISYLPWEIGRLLGDPPRSPSILERPLEVCGEKKPLREHWLAASRKESSTGEEVAKAIAEQLTPEERVAAAIEGVQQKVPWGVKSEELALLVLASAGAEEVPVIVEAIRSIEEKGLPKLWMHGPLAARATALGQLLLIGWSALAKVPPKELARLRRKKEYAAPGTIKALGTWPEIGSRAKGLVEAFTKTK